MLQDDKQKDKMDLWNLEQCLWEKWKVWFQDFTINQKYIYFLLFSLPKLPQNLYDLTSGYL